MDMDSAVKILDLDEMTEIGGYLGGTNEGAQFESSSGQRYYAKRPELQPDQVWTEVLASRLYELAGIPAARVHAGMRNSSDSSSGELWVLSEWVDHTPDVLDRTIEPDSPWMLEVFNGFAVDAWLSNYDVVGDVYTNLVTVDEKPFRLDNGASLYYTATGKEKHWWSEKISDLRDMRFGSDRSVAYESSVEVFGKMTDEQVAQSVWSVLFPMEQRSIELLVEEFGSLVRPNTLEVLLTRKRYIEKRILG